METPRALRSPNLGNLAHPKVAPKSPTAVPDLPCSVLPSQYYPKERLYLTWATWDPRLGTIGEGVSPDVTGSHPRGSGAGALAGAQGGLVTELPSPLTPRPPAAMHKHYTVHFTKGALPLQTPTEHYLLDPELGRQKGRSSVWGVLAGREVCEWGLLSRQLSRRRTPRKRSCQHCPLRLLCGSHRGTTDSRGPRGGSLGWGNSKGDPAGLPLPLAWEEFSSPDRQALGMPPVWGSSVVGGRAGERAPPHIVYEVGGAQLPRMTARASVPGGEGAFTPIRAASAPWGLGLPGQPPSLQPSPSPREMSSPLPPSPGLAPLQGHHHSRLFWTNHASS